MTEDALCLDGNGLAGLLGEVFGGDPTGARRRCPGCGLHSALGEHRAYCGAGVALRCPGCGALALRIGIADERRVVAMSGVLVVDVPAA
jgi:hypothetical protein